MGTRTTGIAMILVPIAFNLIFFALGSAFDYPDILREPAGTILRRFDDGGAELVALWYAFAFTALLAVPLALLLYGVFAREQPHLALAAAIAGVLSALVQALGLFRWAFLVPLLADRYTSAEAAPAARESAVLVFEAAHRYLGVAVGEHLGYLFTAGWTILLGALLFRSGRFSRWLGLLGLVPAAGILIGLLEPAGWDGAGAINAMGYVAWSVWLILLGVALMAASPRQASCADHRKTGA